MPFDPEQSRTKTVQDGVETCKIYNVAVKSEICQVFFWFLVAHLYS